MKPLEDWRVNRGMTGSFLCWKFEGKKSSPLKADISYGRNPLLDGLYLAGRSPSFQDGSTIPVSRLWLSDIEDPAQMMKTEDFFDFIRKAWMNCHLQIF